MFDATPYLAIAAAVNRFVEVLKPGVKQIPVPEEIQAALTQLLSIVLGIILISLAPGLNLFVSVPALTPIVGVILTGAVVGLGAEFIDAVVDLLYSWQRPQPPTVETKTTGGNTEVVINTTPVSESVANAFADEIKRRVG